MRRDGDEFLTAVLLDPRSHRVDRMGERIGPDRREAGMLREPLEVASRRENQPRFTALLALQDFARAQPAGAGAFALNHLRLPTARGAARYKEQRVEPPD